MVDSGNINGAISQISPEMIQNFSKNVSKIQVSQKIIMSKKIIIQI